MATLETEDLDCRIRNHGGLRSSKNAASVKSTAKQGTTRTMDGHVKDYPTE
ncbi:hypothetical protein Slin14017_G094290 [Septoria linicola]|nr:hypothetical protein Slin14017_G094290 [Septoria linicola]